MSGLGGVFSGPNHVKAFGKQPKSLVLILHQFGPCSLKFDEHCVSDTFGRVGDFVGHNDLHRLLALPMVAELAGAAMPLAGEAISPVKSRQATPHHPSHVNHARPMTAAQRGIGSTTSVPA